MRSFNVRPSWICPHLLHIFDDGKNRGADVTLQAYLFALYSTCLRNSQKAASEIAPASLWFAIMP